MIWAPGAGTISLCHVGIQRQRESRRADAIEPVGRGQSPLPLAAVGLWTSFQTLRPRQRARPEPATGSSRHLRSASRRFRADDAGQTACCRRSVIWPPVAPSHRGNAASGVQLSGGVCLERRSLCLRHRCARRRRSGHSIWDKVNTVRRAPGRTCCCPRDLLQPHGDRLGHPTRRAHGGDLLLGCGPVSGLRPALPVGIWCWTSVSPCGARADRPTAVLPAGAPADRSRKRPPARCAAAAAAGRLPCGSAR